MSDPDPEWVHKIVDSVFRRIDPAVHEQVVDVFDPQRGRATERRGIVGLGDVNERAAFEPSFRNMRMSIESVARIALVIAEVVIEIRRHDPKFVAQALLDMKPEHRDQVIVLFDAIKTGGG